MSVASYYEGEPRRKPSLLLAHLRLGATSELCLLSALKLSVSTISKSTDASASKRPGFSADSSAVLLEAYIARLRRHEAKRESQGARLRNRIGDAASSALTSKPTSFHLK